ncbi:type IV inositol polyphosphate 5-phosphatase 9 [Malania oleifera]|uniref:type IV inositol polyphosphate 5-phosphatase 9 n=1 Tax=Malania oleifera TaxID=397392 RepID=UPI0025ADF963|nr:type IV inositol polyphosphate 5-phosphatase 9 [Malania oleifera]
MWPRLVANKILKTRLGSHNFVADFPGDETSLDAPGLNDHESFNPKSLNIHHKHTYTYKVFVSTWNVGGVAPPQDLNMEDWLDACNTPCDIYVLGFQEVIPLIATNVLGRENGKTSTKWNCLIREALNKKIYRSRDGQIENEVSLFTDEDGSRWCNMAGHQESFGCIVSKQMVGILMSVWVRSELRPYITHLSVSYVGCGIMGCLGNKGSVSVRFELHEMSFCFVCTHLASGDKEGDKRHRNLNATQIFSRTIFPGGSSIDLPRKILDHDQVILFGDLNYRISLPEARTRLLVDKTEWNALLRNDQLRTELMDGQVFEGWHEGKINFSPTYKYYPNSDVYYGGDHQGKKDKKRHAPAWCDRIIWLGDRLKQQLYTRGEVKLSDHRPVKAIFTAQV